ncbi:hypothetical protein [Enterocloster clostridioformis]|mgnify:FL=1|jgi:hypothetical protein|uniref:Uncharacterized protein n=1 Tax=Enterocloster clostridioformis TaxID=1531 RepID=A0A829VZF1_9FIRM|nr:hypothetical protein [Enterocloster clostridioformis]EHG33540.1 hypothetical protein HMPREF9467_00745 [ [[Clostridium] clostridioforme 2_1_49FAA]ENZ28761.1 hypothetical protein HMPREF1087_01257 [[Clostridium] clostridioforme 90A1]ENZ72416.1 hypothetical protein HMPREF1081_00831 [[Clostridium] clostridioforme 90A4]QIX93874.1 hypothetical protein FOC47_27025 [Enterocloster clostridioformis]GEA37649.1 hypothetical protein Ccl03g_33620 [Enterocloster clostridioformis]
MEIVLALIGSILMLGAVCYLGSLVLLKDTKEFHMHFGLFKGFDISGTFFDRDKTQED